MTSLLLPHVVFAVLFPRVLIKKAVEDLNSPLHPSPPLTHLPHCAMHADQEGGRRPEQSLGHRLLTAREAAPRGEQCVWGRREGGGHRLLTAREAASWGEQCVWK